MEKRPAGSLPCAGPNAGKECAHGTTGYTAPPVPVRFADSGAAGCLPAAGRSGAGPLPGGGEGWLAEGRTGPESAALLLPYAADAAPARALRRFTRAENTRGGWVVVLGPMDGANLRACLRRAAVRWPAWQTWVVLPGGKGAGCRVCRRVYAAAGRRGVRPALGLAVQWPPGGPPPPAARWPCR